MAIRPGSRLACPDCTVELVVIRPPRAPVLVTCGGLEMVEYGAHRPGAGHPGAVGEGTLVGKRYGDDESGFEVLCAKPGPGALAADGRELAVKAAKPLPASD